MLNLIAKKLEENNINAKTDSRRGLDTVSIILDNKDFSIMFTVIDEETSKLTYSDTRKANELRTVKVTKENIYLAINNIKTLIDLFNKVNETIFSNDFEEI